MKKIIITLDGHSACGKSTLAKAIANELKYIYVDTGAMYRAVTYYFLENGYILKDNKVRSGWEEALSDINVSFNFNSITSLNEVFLNGVSVEERIRMMDVSQHVSTVSKLKKVREKLVLFQKSMGKNKGIVMDGRDIGTIVFPEAEVKLWITASIEVRAARRYKELLEKGHSVKLPEVVSNIELRDYEDSNREESPLRMPEGAAVIDNSVLSKSETLNRAMQFINKRLA